MRTSGCPRRKGSAIAFAGLRLVLSFLGQAFPTRPNLPQLHEPSSAPCGRLSCSAQQKAHDDLRFAWSKICSQALPIQPAVGINCRRFLSFVLPSPAKKSPAEAGLVWAWVGTPAGTPHSAGRLFARSRAVLPGRPSIAAQPGRTRSNRERLWCFAHRPGGAPSLRRLAPQLPAFGTAWQACWMVGSGAAWAPRLRSIAPK